ncbi:phosphoribosyltransferase-like protein [Vibrio phage 1.063.O._10N.261.45.C7]|nr:phosphoribosyltransferase-like protein [Vibrio phage 1.063.O._10N.261.45.C7]
MLEVFSDNKEVNLNRVDFSDGAFTYKLEGISQDAKYISVKVLTSTPVNQVREELSIFGECVMGLVEDGHFSHNVPMYLDLPYLPYGRADRKFEQGNPQPLLGFLHFLEDMGGFDEIYVCDIHNPKAIEGFDLNIIEKTQLECFKGSLPQDFNTSYDFVLAPDKGSVEKSATIACHLDVNVYNCGKERDVSTGKIIRSTLPEGVDFTDKVVLIPDDLCDGNYTFYSLARLLKEAGAKQVDLYVTHMIGSKGLSNITGVIDKIYYYQIVGNYLTKDCILRFNEGCYIELGAN